MKHRKSRRGRVLVPLCVLAVLAIAAIAVFSEELHIFPADVPIVPAQVQVTPAPSQDPFPDAKAEDQPPVQERFIGLAAQNPDTVGRLTFGPVKAQAVVQSDNSFYMNHGFDRKESKSGALFLDERNKLWPMDQNMIIYGHNMRDGSMFGDMDEYRKPAYLKAHPLIAFSTIYDAEDVIYVPIALFDASMAPDNKDYFKVRRPNFSDELELNSWLEDARSRSLYDFGADANAQDTFITLVTCSYSQDDGRFIMIGRRMRDGETAEELSALTANSAKR